AGRSVRERDWPRPAEVFASAARRGRAERPLEPPARAGGQAPREAARRGVRLGAEDLGARERVAGAAPRDQPDPSERIVAVGQPELVALRPPAEVHAALAPAEGVLHAGEDGLEPRLQLGVRVVEAAVPIVDLSTRGDEDLRAHRLPADLEEPEPESLRRAQLASGV